MNIKVEVHRVVEEIQENRKEKKRKDYA